MIKLLDETKNNQEVTHYFIDLDNPNAQFAYSSYEDMREDVKAFDSAINTKSGHISNIGEEWELTDEWEIKEGAIRVRKDGKS